MSFTVIWEGKKEIVINFWEYAANMITLQNCFKRDEIRYFVKSKTSFKNLADFINMNHVKNDLPESFINQSNVFDMKRLSEEFQCEKAEKMITEYLKSNLDFKRMIEYLENKVIRENGEEDIEDNRIIEQMIEKNLEKIFSQFPKLLKKLSICQLDRIFSSSLNRIDQSILFDIIEYLYSSDQDHLNEINEGLDSSISYYSDKFLLLFEHVKFELLDDERFFIFLKLLENNNEKFFLSDICRQFYHKYENIQSKIEIQQAEIDNKLLKFEQKIEIQQNQILEQEKMIKELQEYIKLQIEPKIVDCENLIKDKENQIIQQLDEKMSNQIDKNVKPFINFLVPHFEVENKSDNKGILFHLHSMMINKFDRRYIISQSTNGIHHLIDSNNPDKFSTANENLSTITFEFKDVITLNGMILGSSSWAFPKSFNIVIDGELIISIIDAQELNGKKQRMKILFSERECHKIEIRQTGKGWHQNTYGIVFQYIDFLSPHTKYSPTVFTSMMENTNQNPYLCPVHIYATCFSPEEFLFDNNINGVTWSFNEIKPWIQIEFLDGKILVNGMKIVGYQSRKIKGFELFGCNSDPSSSMNEWTIIFSTSNQRIGVSAFDFPPSGPFKYLRFYQTELCSQGNNLGIKYLDFFGIFKFS